MDTEGNITSDDLVGLPSSYDWRDYGAVNAIFD